jgi:alpha-ketoglutarate-dependent taurine dioxygenase
MNRQQPPSTSSTLGFPVQSFSEIREDNAWAAQIQQLIDGHRWGVIKGFPANPDSLLEWGSALGQVSPKPTYTRGRTFRDGVFNWVGDVRFYDWLSPAERRPTQDSTAIAPHTARSSAAKPPRLFMMLVAEPSPCSRGESVLVRLEDVIAWLRTVYPNDEVTEALRVLRESPLTVSSPSGPIETHILESATDGDRLRYWLDVESDVRSSGSAALLSAWTKLDGALRSPEVAEIIDLEAGDLIVLDNYRVAHGRCEFPRWEAGNRQVIASRRRLFSLHVHLPDEDARGS